MLVMTINFPNIKCSMMMPMAMLKTQVRLKDIPLKIKFQKNNSNKPMNLINEKIQIELKNFSSICSKKNQLKGLESKIKQRVNSLPKNDKKTSGVVPIVKKFKNYTMFCLIMFPTYTEKRYKILTTVRTNL